MFQDIVTFLQTNKTGLIVGFIPGFVFFILPPIIRAIYNYAATRSSSITGWWEQCIYDIGDDNYKGTVKKTDYYKLKHNTFISSNKLTINIKGKIRREKPKPGRKWDVCGYLDGDILTMIYQSRNRAQKSRGCIYVKLKRHEEPNDEFRGFYLEEHEDGLIDKTPLILRKVNDHEKEKQLQSWERHS